MNGNDIGRILEEHRIRMIRATGIVCECGLEFETEERHRKHVADRLRTWANGEHGIEYLRRLIARILFLHPWGDGTTVDGGVKCPCGHASDDMPGHHRHVCEELADAIIDTEKEWNRKCTEPRIEETLHHIVGTVNLARPMRVRRYREMRRSSPAYRRDNQRNENKEES